MRDILNSARNIASERLIHELQEVTWAWKNPGNAETL